MLTYRDFSRAFQELGLSNDSQVIAHASLSAFGEVAGGAETIVGAMLSSFRSVVMPTFTYRTMITPSVGPPDNALAYGEADEQNLAAEIFRHDMPADPEMGIIAETLRLHPNANRSSHPILSFAGVNAEAAIEAQTLEEPLTPIGVLAEEDADVLLLGVDHTRNTSLHYAEMRAGRKQFVRWALTTKGVVACPRWPGCSDGFQAINPYLNGVVRLGRLGSAVVEAVPLRDLIHIVVSWIHEDPRALLCDRTGCERCAATRASVRSPS